MVARRPFVVIAKKEFGFLLFRNPQPKAWSRTGRIPLLVVVLPDVARLVVKAADLEEQTILRGDLLFEAEGEIELFEIVVRSLTVLFPIRRVERIAARPVHAVVRSTLHPVAIVGVFRAREEAEPVPVEELRVFLLRNILRQGAATRRR